jgi:hypothetical protein
MRPRCWTWWQLTQPMMSRHSVRSSSTKTMARAKSLTSRFAKFPIKMEDRFSKLKSRRVTQTTRGSVVALDMLIDATPGRLTKLADSAVFRVRNPEELSAATEPTLSDLAQVHAPGMESTS